MNNVIFEDPSKQRPRGKRPSPVQLIEVTPNLNEPNSGEQQKCAPSQSLDAFNPENDSSGRLSDKSTNYVNYDKDGQVRETPTKSDFDPPVVTLFSVLEPFSMSDVDHHSVEDERASQRDSLFSSPEPEGSVADSDTSVYSIVDKRGKAPTLERLGSSHWAGRGKDPAILFEDDVLDGDAANWVTLQNEMLDAEIDKPESRIRPSPPHREDEDDVEPGTEVDSSERGEDVHHVTTTRGDCQLGENPRMLGGIQLYPLNGARNNAQEIASPAFPSPRKRRRVRRPESPSQGPSARDDQASCQKVSDARPCHNRRTDQERRPQKSNLGFPRSRVPTRSLSRSLPLSPDMGEHTLEGEVVWEYGHLLHYRIVNGNPQVLVPWVPTWEPAGEYPPEDVDRVRRESQGQMQARRRGRPRSKHHIRM